MDPPNANIINQDDDQAVGDNNHENLVNNNNEEDAARAIVRNEGGGDNDGGEEDDDDDDDEIPQIEDMIRSQTESYQNALREQKRKLDIALDRVDESIALKESKKQKIEAELNNVTNFLGATGAANDGADRQLIAASQNNRSIEFLYPPLVVDALGRLREIIDNHAAFFQIKFLVRQWITAVSQQGHSRIKPVLFIFDSQQEQGVILPSLLPALTEILYALGIIRFGRCFRPNSGDNDNEIGNVLNRAEGGVFCLEESIYLFEAKELYFRNILQAAREMGTYMISADLAPNYVTLRNNPARMRDMLSKFTIINFANCVFSQFTSAFRDCLIRNSFATNEGVFSFVESLVQNKYIFQGEEEQQADTEAEKFWKLVKLVYDKFLFVSLSRSNSTIRLEDVEVAADQLMLKRN